MKRRTLLAAAALLAAGWASAADLPAVRQRGALRVVVARAEQPEMFNLGTAGEPGFERELVDGFAKAQKLRLEVVSVPRYDDRIPALLEDKGDLITGIVATEARRQQIDFALEVMPTRRVVVSRKPAPPVRTVEDLRAQKVGILAGARTWIEAAVDSGVPAAKIQAFPTLEAVFEGLRTGKITATVLSLSDLGLALRKDPALQPGVMIGPATSAGWGVRKQDAELQKALTEYLAATRKAPTWSRLIVKYFGEETLLALGKAGN